MLRKSYDRLVSKSTTSASSFIYIDARLDNANATPNDLLDQTNLSQLLQNCKELIDFPIISKWLQKKTIDRMPASRFTNNIRRSSHLLRRHTSTGYECSTLSGFDRRCSSDAVLIVSIVSCTHSSQHVSDRPPIASFSFLESR
jgi:hypothetical protein